MAIIRRRKITHGNPAENSKEAGAGFQDSPEPAGAPGAGLPEDAELEEELAERLTDSVLHEDGYSRRRPKRRKIRVELIKEPAQSGPDSADNGSEPAGEAAGSAVPAEAGSAASGETQAAGSGAGAPTAAAAAASSGATPALSGAVAPAYGGGVPPGGAGAAGTGDGGHHRGRVHPPQNREKLLINDLSLTGMPELRSLANSLMPYQIIQ